MDIRHLTPADYRTSRWSGGTTTEIFIWPADADYAARRFAVRISSATVELEESDFTALPGVTRYIVPLAGGFTLTHPEGQPVIMEPLDAPYRFSGEIPTHCVGKATDFNLMLKGAEGIMDICRENAPILPGVTCLYAPHGGRITLAGAEYALSAGDSLQIFARESHTASLTAPVIRCHADI